MSEATLEHPGMTHPEWTESTFIWEWPVRVAHWTIFFSILTLAVTGIYIGRPFLAAPVGTGHFITGYVRIVHYYAALAFTLAVISRVVWMFIGNKWARWNQLVPTTKLRLKKIWGSFLFYSLIRPRPPGVSGHNPLAGAAYLGVFGLYFVMIITGLGLYAHSQPTSILHVFDVFLWPFGGPQYARWTHHIVMWLLLLFAVQHVYSCILMSIVEDNGEIDSIFSGWKHLRRKDVGDD